MPTVSAKLSYVSKSCKRKNMFTVKDFFNSFFVNTFASSTVLVSILIVASCVKHRPLVFTYLVVCIILRMCTTPMDDAGLKITTKNIITTKY